MAATYVNPLAGIQYKLGRVDQGLDIETGKGNVGKPIGALGPGQVVAINKNYQGFGQYIAYRLTAGPAAGRVIYVGHSQVAPGLKLGDPLQAGEPVAIIRGYKAWAGHVEMGFANPHNPSQLLAQASSGHPVRGTTSAGMSFRDLFASVEGSQPTASDQTLAPAPTVSPTISPDQGTPPDPYAVSPPGGPAYSPPGLLPPGTVGASGLSARALAQSWRVIASQPNASPISSQWLQNTQTAGNG